MDYFLDPAWSLLTDWILMDIRMPVMDAWFDSPPQPAPAHPRAKDIPIRSQPTG